MAKVLNFDLEKHKANIREKRRENQFHEQEHSKLLYDQMIEEKKRKEKEKASREQELLRVNSMIRTQAIKDILERRKIQKLVHFTRIDNLDSILGRGILPVRQLRERNIEYVCNDEGRKDFRLDCTSFSIEYPNGRVLKRFRKKYENSRWVLLVLDTALLFDHRCYFSKYNTATGVIAKHLSEYESVKAFRCILRSSTAGFAEQNGPDAEPAAA